MKRLFPILLTALLFASCGGGGTEPEGPKAVTVSLGTTSLSFDATSPSSKTVSVTADGRWTASKSDSWFSVEPSSGSGNATVTVTAGSNTTSSPRTGTITFKGEGSSQGVSVSLSQAAVVSTGPVEIVPSPAAFDGNRRSSTTYQLLVYSFADSDGDGVGDFGGIEQHLDYLTGELGVTALWLSPVHPSDSYHGYNVQDYYAINEAYGGESAFRSLLDKAHAKGVKIYLDYVLNHSGKGNAWFKEALADPSSPYNDYYFLTPDPASDYSSFPMLAGTSYVQGEWKLAASGAPKIKISKTDEAVKTGSSNWNLWLWKSGQDGKALKFVDNGDGTMYLVTEISGASGLLLRQVDGWDDGSKYGAGGTSTLTEGGQLTLVPDGGDISFNGSGRYRIELSDVPKTRYYMGCFDSSMPDLNYGSPASFESNVAFKDLAASADKWINMGVDGLRLDAVKHICGGLDERNDNSNITFLQKWYEHCNATYKAAGHSDDIFMVGEMWDTSHNAEKNYYKGLTSCFEFGYWPLLYGALVKGNASNYASGVMRFISDHKAARADAVTSIFMTNHDHASQTGDGEVRAADDLGRNLAREKQAAAMLLTTEGKPFIYQGEELGYWGTSKGKGDEYIRTPIMWDKAGKDVARKGVDGKVDESMLTSSISVEAQLSDEASLLRTYKSFSQLRNTYPALAEGSMSTGTGIASSSVASWYMSTSGQKLLVVHNTGSSSVTVSAKDDLSRPVALLGSGTVDGKKLTLSANSSVVFEL